MMVKKNILVLLIIVFFVELLKAQCPHPRIRITSDTFGCAPLKIKFENLSDTLCQSIIYRFGDGSGVNPFDHRSHVYTKAGIYYIFIDGTGTVFDTASQSWRNCTVTFPDTTKEPPIIINVLKTPEARMGVDSIITRRQPVNFWNLSDTVYTKLIWDFGDGFSDSLQRINTNIPDTMQHIYTKAGVYTVRFRPQYTVSSNGPFCKQEYTEVINVLHFNNSVGLPDNYQFKVYSNSEQLYIQLPENINTRLITISDLQGRLLWKQKLSNNGILVPIYISELKAGIYVIGLVFDTTQQYFKWINEKDF